jgi:NADH:ubiquinone reductase (non-electrogenic)
VSTSRG